MRFKVSACIRISNWFWIKLEQNHGFGMQVCVYAPGPMSWYALVYSDMRFKVCACIRISNWFRVKLAQNHGFGMQVCVYAPGPMSWYAITANSCINSVLSILSKIGSRARKFIMPFLEEFFWFLLNV